MKKGLGTMEYVIAAVIILLFAGTTLYAFVPRLERGPGLVEQFFPEECELTGLTRDDYLRSITDALGRADEAAARKTYIDMKNCFADADIPADQKDFLFRTVRGRLATLKQSTFVNFREIRSIYEDTKAFAPLNAWSPEELVTFARALRWAGSSDDAIAVSQALLARTRKTGTANEAAALHELGYLLWFKDEKASLDAYTQLDDRFSVRDANPDIKFYVGHALLKLRDMDPQAKFETQLARRQYGLQAVQEAFDTTSSQYVKREAGYTLIAYHVKANEYADAARMFETMLDAEFNHPNAMFFSNALDRYGKIPAANRAIADCSRNVKLPVGGRGCMCMTKEGTFLLPVENIPPGQISPLFDYCCLEFISNKPCLCNTLTKCEDYKSQDDCTNNPCMFQTCIWVEPIIEGQNYCKTSP